MIPSFKQYMEYMDKVAETGAIYDGTPDADNDGNPKATFNWWGAPKTAGKTQQQAQAMMNKKIKNQKKQ